MVTEITHGTVSGGLFYAIKIGAELADIQTFANSKKTADYTKAKLGKVTAYNGEDVLAEAEIILVHGSDDLGVKTLMISAQAKVRAQLAGKKTGKRTGRNID